MASRLDHESKARGPGNRAGAAEPGIGRSIFLRTATRRSGLLTHSLLLGFAGGVAYRFLFDPPVERDLGNFLRSGVSGAGLFLAVLAVQFGFASGGRSRLGAALRRLPLAGEVVVRALVMAAVLIVAGLTLQFLLYWDRYHLDWLNRRWLTVNLPRTVLAGFLFSLVVGVVVQTESD